MYSLQKAYRKPLRLSYATKPKDLRLQINSDSLRALDFVPLTNKD